MLDLEENKRFLVELQSRLKELENDLKISTLREKLSELEKQTLKENFWDDSQKSSEIFSKMSVIQKKLRMFDNLKNELQNLLDLNELLILESDSSLEKDLISNTEKLTKEFDDIEVQTLLSGKYDANNAIVTLHPGAGRNGITRLGRNAL